MFADIRGFTTLSEKLTPAELVELLNELLNEMTEIIRKNWGTPGKCIGDAMMSFWGEPQSQSDQALRVCTTGLEMLDSLKLLQTSWKLRGLPSLDIRVGINSGPMLVGYMGSKLRRTTRSWATA